MMHVTPFNCEALELYMDLALYKINILYYYKWQLGAQVLVQEAARSSGAGSKWRELR